MAGHRTKYCPKVYVPCPHGGCPAKTKPTFTRDEVGYMNCGHPVTCDYKPVACKQCEEVGRVPKIVRLPSPPWTLTPGREYDVIRLISKRIVRRTRPCALRSLCRASCAPRWCGGRGWRSTWPTQVARALTP
jgi:hypothetical protein